MFQHVFLPSLGLRGQGSVLYDPWGILPPHYLRVAEKVHAIKCAGDFCAAQERKIHSLYGGRDLWPRSPVRFRHGRLWSNLQTAVRLARAERSAYPDRSATPGIRRLQFDAQGQGEERGFKLLRVEGESPLTGDGTRFNASWDNVGLSLQYTNRLLAVLRDVAMASSRQNPPIGPLFGDVPIVVRYDPTPGDVSGFPNAFSVVDEKGPGDIVFGQLNGAESEVFNPPDETFGIAAHEVWHKGKHRIHPELLQYGMNGAFDEAISDLFAKFMEQVILREGAALSTRLIENPNTPESWAEWALWLSADHFLKDTERPQGLRHAYSRRAYADLPILGTDIANPQHPKMPDIELDRVYDLIFALDFDGVHLEAPAFSYVWFHQTANFDGFVTGPLLIATLGLMLNRLAGEVHLGLKGAADYQWLAAQILERLLAKDPDLLRRHGLPDVNFKDAPDKVASAWQRAFGVTPQRLGQQGLP